MNKHEVFTPIKAVSADSHISEPPVIYNEYMDPKFRNSAPKLIKDPRPGMKGEGYVVEGFPVFFSLGLVAAAGVPSSELQEGGKDFDQLHRGGWDPIARMADQDRDGIAAEFIYPTIGMTLCAHPDDDYKHACFEAYNRWLQEFCAARPTRLFGLGQTAVRTVEETVKQVHQFKEMGFKGVMLPLHPCTEFDYDDPRFDPLWSASVQLDMPISFHIFTGGKQAAGAEPRGPKIMMWSAVIRSCQDVIGMFIYGRVFERHPKLKLVCVEADAGWAPHFMYRMDHVYKRHRAWLKCDEMQKLPSEYFRDNVYMTFQDDWVAFNMLDMVNPRQLLWANDFPHSDSTWPWSQELLAEHTKTLTQQERQWVLRDNTIELYKLDKVG